MPFPNSLVLHLSSISTMILFKNHFVIDRDMSEMFKRFQVGKRYFGNEEEESRIFQVSFSANHDNKLADARQNC